ncbi:YCF48-related protein [Myxosarcina sp. GI1]|uniref:WD40/YVTN/BNR-like repeat-containing protein n=1 Tax=Myxosarcina sp. GI1 TaxID=1541065 RepID=UPI000566964E|nr:YCF48-related protein [Myxosarcina sp. GI1]
MNWKNLPILRVGKGIGVLALSILTFTLVNVEAGLTHVPHDVVFDVEVSPNYQRDRTVYHLIDSGNKIWGNVFKSEDGGSSWQRIERGLDNKHLLSSLDIAASSSNTLYLSTMGDGIYKSEDGGNSWFKVNQGLKTTNLNLVEVSPHSPDLVLAAGTKAGLYKTSDGGESWHQVLDGDSPILAIAFATNSQDNIAIADSRGNIYLSGDGGETWQLKYTLQDAGMVTAITFSPNFATDSTLFVGTERQGVFKTSDGGNSFAAVNRGLSDLSVVSLNLSPNFGTDSTLVAATWYEGVFTSNDGGNTWKKTSSGLKKTPQADKYHEPNFQQLSISPTFERDSTIFVSGFDGLFKTTDGGSNWQDVRVADSGVNKIKKLAISPNYEVDSTVAVATYYQGAYLSQDRGNNWTAIDGGLKEPSLLKENLLTNVLTLSFSPNYSNDNTIFVCATGSFYKSTDRGKHWQHLKLPQTLNADQYMVVSPNYASDRTIYLFNIRGGVLRSTDGGESFSEIGNIGNPAAYIPSLAISPDFASDRTIYVGGFPGGVYKTTDGGSTWNLASDGIEAKEAYLALAISPNYQVDRTILAGTSEGIFKTTDAAQSWEKLAGTAYGGDGYIDEIAISSDYQHDATAIASVRGKGLFITEDGGETFTQIDDYVTGPLEFSPNYASDRTIYTSSENQLFQSTDSGRTWNAIEIPTRQNNFVINYLTYIYLRLSESPLLKFIAAVLAALVSYLLLGYFRLEKRLRMRKGLVRSASTLAVFMGVFIFLSIY